MYEVQLVAPKPRKPILSVFDQASFDASSLIPLPEGVGSFLEVSMDPNAFLDWLGQMGPGGALKTAVDEFADAIRTSAKIDFRKDFLGQVGPRMVLFMAPDNSAKVGSGPFGMDLLKGPDPQAFLMSLGKLTLVAEVREPKPFARTLEGAVNALNHQLTEQTAEALEQAEAGKEQPGDDGARAGGARAGGARAGGGAGGQRGARQAPAQPTGPAIPADAGTGRVDHRIYPPDAQRFAREARPRQLPPGDPVRGEVPRCLGRE